MHTHVVLEMKVLCAHANVGCSPTLIYDLPFPCPSCVGRMSTIDCTASLSFLCTALPPPSSLLWCRRLLSREKEPLVNDVIKSGVVPKLVEFLANDARLVPTKSLLNINGESMLFCLLLFEQFAVFNLYFQEGGASPQTLKLQRKMMA